MSKSVLVIDTPERCTYCKIGQNYISIIENCVFCPIAGKSTLGEVAETIPDWCPLKPLPEKMKIAGLYKGEYFKEGDRPPSYKIGWNNCIDEITGGEVYDKN